MSRPRNARTFKGLPCKYDGTMVRYLSGHCVRCARVRSAKAYTARKAKAAKQYARLPEFLK